MEKNLNKSHQQSPSEFRAATSDPSAANGGKSTEPGSALEHNFWLLNDYLKLRKTKINPDRFLFAFLLTFQNIMDQ